MSPGTLQRANTSGLTFALQALLSRHESYMAESEAERQKMATHISTLEQEKRNLEHRNTDVVQQNRNLLDHLEGLNTTIADSDAHIASLVATLAEAQYEVRRLTQLVAKTTELEQQLEAMELGQAKLQQELKESEEEERSAVWRWKDAEARVRDMNEQVERIDREAQYEREKHVELVGRMERRRVVEKELENAAGRLKGAAAAGSLHGGSAKGNGGTNVVSHFVRDILQDNANLQAGVVELRELLANSNEEVQNLRETVMLHQPVTNDTQQDEDTKGNELHEQTTPLNEELEWAAGPKPASQEVHVHHHYHAKFSTKKERTPLARRGSKKRTAIGISNSTPDSPMLGPRLSRRSDQSVSPAPLSSSIPYTTSRRSRWSVQSAATGSSTISSLPNSPPSYFNNGASSIFDRIDAGSESSRPTSPESSGFASPQFGLGHRKGQISDFSLSSFAEMPEDSESSTQHSARRVLRPPDSDPALAGIQQETQNDVAAVVEEDAMDPLDTGSTSASLPQFLDDDNSTIQPHSVDSETEMMLELEEASPPTKSQNPKLHRSSSHDSLVSISGMDIHIPRNSTSTQIFTTGRGFSPRSSRALLPARTLPSSRALASIVEVNASSATLRSVSDSSSISILSGLASQSSASPSAKHGLGQLVGGWVRGKWGIAPTASVGDLRGQAQAQVAPFAGRPPGINQRGSVPGLKPPVRTPSEVHARVLNEGLLKESLAE